MVRIAIVESLEMRKRLCCSSIERELYISRKVVQELLENKNNNHDDDNELLIYSWQREEIAN